MTIDFSKIWLGMENDWYMKNSDTSYPRYNIVENTVAGSFRLEIAVPGWQQEELELIQQMNTDYTKAKMAIADAELTKQTSLHAIEVIREQFSNHEKILIDKYGKDAVINMQTGEITQKENGKDD